MKFKIKQILTAVILLAFVASISSCNRGYGCPNNFKAAVEKTTQAAQTVHAIVKK